MIRKVCALLAIGCLPLLVAHPASAQSVADRLLIVRLRWLGRTDLDLMIVGPDGQLVLRGSEARPFLRFDAMGRAGERLQTARWTIIPPDGEYRVCVGADAAIEFELEIMQGSRAASRTDAREAPTPLPEDAARCASGSPAWVGTFFVGRRAPAVATAPPTDREPDDLEPDDAQRDRASAAASTASAAGSGDAPREAPTARESASTARGGAVARDSSVSEPPAAASSPSETREPDADGDGVPDELDDCDDGREDDNGYDQHDGCPDGSSGLLADAFVHPVRAMLSMGVLVNDLGPNFEIRGDLRLYAIELGVRGGSQGLGFGITLAPFEIGTWTNQANKTGLTFEPVIAVNFFPWEQITATFEIGLRVYAHVDAFFMIGVDLRVATSAVGPTFVALGNLGGGMLL